MNKGTILRGVRVLLAGPQRMTNHVRLTNPIACIILNNIDRYYNIFGGFFISMWFFTNIFDKFSNFSLKLMLYRMKLRAKRLFIPMPFQCRV